MTSYPYSDPFDRFADCRYTERKPELTHTICPICGERKDVLDENEKVVRNVT